MKKLSSVLSAILCALLIACLAVSACAEEVPTSNVYRPKISETFKAITAGKTFEAQVSRNEVYGQDEDAIWTINITACEETHFKAEDIENLKANDIIAFNPGEAIFIVEKTAEEDGFRLVDSNSVVYYFTKAEDGDYIGRTENDNMFFTAIFTITIPLDKDISFLDWSDPENLEAPVKKGYDELLDLLLEDTDFAPYNTKVTFDENGMLTELLYTYSPWN